MKTNDGRTRRLDTLNFVRKRAIEVFKQGYNRGITADILGINRNSVGTWINIYHKHGLSGLEFKKPGRKTGSGRRLIPEQEQGIQKKKIFLIVDNLPVHHSKPVKRWLEENVEYIEICFLPSYSPHDNPDEYLNRDLKQSIVNKPPARNKNQLKRQVVSHLKSIPK